MRDHLLKEVRRVAGTDAHPGEKGIAGLGVAQELAQGLLAEIRHDLHDLDGVARVLLEAGRETLAVVGDVFEYAVGVEKLPRPHVGDLVEGLARAPLVLGHRVVEVQRGYDVVDDAVHADGIDAIRRAQKVHHHPQVASDRQSECGRVEGLEVIPVDLQDLPCARGLLVPEVVDHPQRSGGRIAVKCPRAIEGFAREQRVEQGLEVVAAHALDLGIDVRRVGHAAANFLRIDRVEGSAGAVAQLEGLLPQLQKTLRVASTLLDEEGPAVGVVEGALHPALGHPIVAAHELDRGPGVAVAMRPWAAGCPR